MDYVKQFFAEGCPICSGTIFFDSQSYSYHCKDCQAYVSAHRVDSDYAVKGQPQGYIANKEINLLRQAVTNVMTPLYMEKTKVQGKHAHIDTSLINVIYTDYCVKVIVDKGEMLYAAVISSQDDDSTNVRLIETGQMATIKSGYIRRVTNKEKTYIWLAGQLGLKTEQAHIKHLNKKELEKALEVLTKAVSQARQQAINSS